MAECQVQIPHVDGLEDHVLTVGREFVLSCKGDFSKLETGVEWTVQYSEKLKGPPPLKILKFQGINPHEMQFFVTSYLAGQHKLEPLIVQAGSESISLGNVSIQVQSVIEQQGMVQEPYGPLVGRMSFPISLWIVTALVVVSIVGFIVNKYRRYSQRKSLLEQLGRHDAAVSPLTEIHQNYRRWRRQHKFFYLNEAEVSQSELMQVLGEVDHAFRIYLARAFRVPALQWGPRLILKDMKKYHRPVYRSHGQELKKYMIEIEKAKEAAAQIKAQDVVQLTENLRILAEKLEAAP